MTRRCLAPLLLCGLTLGPACNGGPPAPRTAAQAAMAATANPGATPDGESADAAQSGGDPSGETDDQFLAEAHRGAMASATQLATSYLEARCPVQSAYVSGGALEAPPMGRARAEEFTAKLAELSRAFAGMESKWLDQVDKGRLLAFEYLIARDTWLFGQGGVYRSDPHAYLRDLEALIAEVEHRQLFAAPCPSCDPALGAAANAIEQYLVTLNACAPAHVRSAAQRAGALAKRVRALAVEEPSGAGAQQLVGALEAVPARLTALLDVDASPVSWSTPLGSGRSGGDSILPRPDAWDAAYAKLVLENEEGWAPTKGLHLAAAANLSRYRKMREHFASSPAQDDPTVEVAECGTRYLQMRAQLGLSNEPAPKRPSCAVIAAAIGAAETKAQTLDELLLRRALVPLLHHELAASRGGTVGSIWGTAIPVSSLELRLVMLAAALKRPGIAITALENIEQGVCTTVAAAVTHGLSPAPDEGLDPWLARECAGASPGEWRERAVADPRAALAYISAATLGPAPTDMVAAVEYPWAPIGLAVALSTPLEDPAQVDEGANTAEVKIEVLGVDGEILPPKPADAPAPSGVGTPP